MARKQKRKSRGKCPRCKELEQRCKQLEQKCRKLEEENRRLTERLKALEERLGLNSQNSSLSPSNDPPTAPPRQKKKPTGRKRGGQPGHKGTHRELLPVEEVNEVIEHFPENCEHCKAPLSQDSILPDCAPVRHQVTELKEKLYEVTEHQAHAACCGSCGAVTRAEIPPEFRSAFGPRLVALVASLTGVVKASRRGAQEFLRDNLGIPISLGAVSALESEVADSLAESHAEASKEVSEAESKNVDETGWKQRGAKRWLWAAATATIAFYVIHRSRGKQAFRTLLKKIRGFFTTDRWHVYASVSKRRRQICWSHLKRDFRRIEQKGGEAGRIGKDAGIITSHVFMLWKDFKAGIIDRRALKACLRPLKKDLREYLERGVALGQRGVSRFCQNLLDLEPALWNFASYEGIEPTNNHAERVLRAAVIWRKRSFGCDSDRGCRYVERIMTVAQSCRLQRRCIYDFLVESIIAHRTGSVPPSIVHCPA